MTTDRAITAIEWLLVIKTTSWSYSGIALNITIETNPQIENLGPKKDEILLVNIII